MALIAKHSHAMYNKWQYKEGNIVRKNGNSLIRNWK